jgi:hypothetical protein
MDASASAIRCTNRYINVTVSFTATECGLPALIFDFLHQLFRRGVDYPDPGARLEIG